MTTRTAERAAVTGALARVLADRPEAAAHAGQLRPMLEDQLQGQARSCRPELSQVLAVIEEGFVVDGPDAAARVAPQLAAVRGFAEEVATWASYAWLGPEAVPEPIAERHAGPAPAPEPPEYEPVPPPAAAPQPARPEASQPAARGTASTAQVVLAFVGGLLFALGTLVPVAQFTQVRPDDQGIIYANPALAPRTRPVGEQWTDNGFAAVSVQATVWAGFVGGLAIALAALVLRKRRRALTVSTLVLSLTVGAGAFYVLDNSKFRDAVGSYTTRREALPGRYLVVVAAVLILASIAAGIAAAVRDRRSA